MLRRLTPFALLAALAGVTVTVRTAPADDPPLKKKADAEKPKTVKAEKGTLVQSVSLKGTIEGEKGCEITVRPKVWFGQLQVKRAVEHGAMVKAGDVLVEFETEKIDQSIKDAKQERDLANLSIQQADLDIPILERQQPLDIAAAERDAKNAADDFEKFQKIDKPLAIESAEQSLKSSAYFLETAKDELKQLSKMYKDKDLTEETEEIVLKRYKHNVDQSEFSFKLAKNRYEQTTKIDMPRREVANKDAVMKAELALIKARDVAPLSLKQKQLGLLKLKYEEAKSRDRLADLEKDRAMFAVTAPADGMAYHGRSVRGQWMLPMSQMGAALAPGGQIMNGEVFLTVIPVGKLMVRADADEKEYANLQVGIAGKATPATNLLARLPVKITKLGSAPLNGKFEVYAELTEEKGKLVPGMTCSLRFIQNTYFSAISVPATAIFEEDDGESKYVYLPGKDGKGEKKTVKVGITVGEKTQILEGLKADDEILPTKPSAGGEK